MNVAPRLSSFLFVLATLSFSSARADFVLECRAKSSSAAAGKLCEKSVAATAAKMGCDHAGVVCESAGAAEFACTVRSLSCETWVNRPLPEAPKKIEPKPAEPSPTPSPSARPRKTVGDDKTIDLGDDDSLSFPARDRRDDADDGFDPKKSSDPKTDPKLDPKPSEETKPVSVEPVREEPIDPNRGCRRGFMKVSGASVKGPETYCRADSFALEARSGACAMAWSRESRDLFRCSNCFTALGETRCEADAAILLKSVNHGCASIVATPKDNSEFEIRCIGPGTPEPPLPVGKPIR